MIRSTSSQPEISLLPLRGLSDCSSRGPGAPRPEFVWRRRGYELGEMFASRHRGAGSAEQEGLGGMVLDPKVGGRTGMKGHERQARENLLA